MDTSQEIAVEVFSLVVMGIAWGLSALVFVITFCKVKRWWSRLLVVPMFGASVLMGYSLGLLLRILGVW